MPKEKDLDKEVRKTMEEINTSAKEGNLRRHHFHRGQQEVEAAAQSAPVWQGNPVGACVAVGHTTGWDSGLAERKECSFAEKVVTAIVIGVETQQRVMAMNKLMGHTEWLGFLIGKLDTVNKEYVITELEIPKQEVTTASVEVTEDSKTEGVIGTVHSHHSMGSFFSGTDLNYVVGNHPVTLVVSTSGWVAKIRTLLPCGGYHLDAGEITFEATIDAKAEKFAEDAKKKIFKPAPVVYTGYVPYTGAPGQGFDQMSCYMLCHYCGEWKPFTTQNNNFRVCPSCLGAGKVDEKPMYPQGKIWHQEGMSAASTFCVGCDRWREDCKRGVLGNLCSECNKEIFGVSGAENEPVINYGQEL